MLTEYIRGGKQKAHQAEYTARRYNKNCPLSNLHHDWRKATNFPSVRSNQLCLSEMVWERWHDFECEMFETEQMSFD